MKFIVRFIIPMLVFSLLCGMIGGLIVLPFFVNIGLSLAAAKVINFVLFFVIGYMFGGVLINFWSNK